MAKKKSSALSSKEADALFKQFAKAPAALSDEQCAKIAARFASQDHMRKMRLTLAMQTKSGAFLEGLAKGKQEQAEALAVSLVLVQDFSDGLKAMLEIAESAAARCGVALAYREDMQQLIASAEASTEAA